MSYIAGIDPYKNNNSSLGAVYYVDREGHIVPPFRPKTIAKEFGKMLGRVLCSYKTQKN